MNAIINDSHKAEEYFAGKNSFTTGPVEVSKMMENHQPIVLIDVRAAEDFNRSHLPGAVNLPQEEWATHRGLDRKGPNVLYCYSETCHLASKAAQQFAEAGYPVMEMQGGFESWQEHDLEVEK